MRATRPPGVRCVDVEGDAEMPRRCVDLSGEYLGEENPSRPSLLISTQRLGALGSTSPSVRLMYRPTHVSPPGNPPRGTCPSPAPQTSPPAPPRASRPPAPPPPAASPRSRAPPAPPSGGAPPP